MNDTLAIEPKRCCLCHRILSSEVVEPMAMNICGDCKFLFVEDTDTLTLTQHSTPTTRYNSSPESIENILSQEFPDMINLARHMQPIVSDHDHGYQSRSRQWRRVLSDTESDDFDSVFEETDIFPYSNSNSGSYDTDSDSIHSDLNQWNSDDHDDDDDDDDDGENTHGSLLGRAQLHRSLATNGRNLSVDWLREVLSPEAGIGIGISERRGIDGNLEEQVTWRSVGEYLDGEIDRGAPPASASFVKNLERVVVGDDDVEGLGLVCVICKDSVCVGSVVNRLPCLHVYHPSCITPWLNAHNTCPLCRYELPTDSDRRRPDRSHALVGESENVSGGGGGGGWWFVVAPLVSVVGIGLMLWLGGCSSGMENISRRWWSLL
ncbi:hypothetical protein Lser_V15G25899 [Lactuca serriola]